MDKSDYEDALKKVRYMIVTLEDIYTGCTDSGLLGTLFILKEQLESLEDRLCFEVGE